MTRLEIVVPEDVVGPRVLVNGAVHDRFLRGRLTVSDLAPGPHTVAVGADGCRGRVLVIVLHPDETRRLEVSLRPRRNELAPGAK